MISVWIGALLYELEGMLRKYYNFWGGTFPTFLFTQTTVYMRDGNISQSDEKRTKLHNTQMTNY